MLKSSSLPRLLLSAALAAGFVALYLNGLAAVPFHPDESTQLYMSRDFEALVLQHDPAALVWTPGQPLTLEARYRLLDAPLTKYLVGLGWWLRGYSTADLNGDWVWGATWEANQQALPRADVLLAGRGPLAVLGALATVVMFWIGCEVGGMGVGLIAALLLGLDPLSLLHTRRAMAEGSLIFFSALAAWGSLRLARACDAGETFRRRLFAGSALAGVLAGLAMASKQTELVMLPVALLAIGLPLLQRPWPLAQRLRALAAIWLVIGLGGALTFWALNPILYRQPLNVAQKMLELRAQLAQEQIEVNGAAHPDMLTPTPLARLRAAFWQVYVRPPAFWDAPVYLDHLKPLTETYLSSSINNLLRRSWFGPVIAVLSAVGVAASGYRLIRGRLSPATRAGQVVWWWSAATLVLLLFAIPLDWQRYFLPLLAPARLFAAMGLAALFRLFAYTFPALASFVRRSRLALRRGS